MLTYVKPADFDPQLQDDENLPRLIRFASLTVRNHTRRAVYKTTPAGLPSDEEIMEAFRLATMEQVLALHGSGAGKVIATGANPTGVVKTAGVNGATVTYDTATQEDYMNALIGGGLCPAAEAILTDAGLLGPQLPGVVYW